MRKLFIIGNGFDIAHGLQTSYKDFYNFLICEYPSAEDKEIYGINTTMLPDGVITYDVNEAVAFIIDLISKVEGNGENWADVESSLGKLNFNEYLDEDLYIEYDEEGDIDYGKLYRANEDLSSEFIYPTLRVSALFSDWINSIDINHVQYKQTFQQLINLKEDTFLNFNYTTTLQEIYHVPNVYHIHGQQGNDIIIGHGEEPPQYPIGSEWNLARIHEDLRKPVSSLINESQEFFRSLKGVREIYSYGFSFSSVDLPYICEICRHIDTFYVTWYLSGYEKDTERKDYMHRIRKSGFKGEFRTFNI